MKLLTEFEVGKRLGITRQAVQRLRRAGKLPFIPGVPALIDERDLRAYVEKIAAEKAAKASVKRAPPRMTEEQKFKAWEFRTKVRLAWRAEEVRRKRELGGD